ncbi:MAG: transglutaminase domain-containing protein, partial [Micromonosporaceae bacterium]
MSGPAVGTAGSLVSAVALAAMTAAASLVAARLYAGWQMPLVLAGAAGAAVVLTGLLRWLSGNAALAVLGSVAGMGAGLTGLSAALQGRARAGGPLTAVLADALSNSGARLMTSSIPVEPAPDTVALPIVATWLAGTVSALLYARWPVTALLPPVAL